MTPNQARDELKKGLKVFKAFKNLDEILETVTQAEQLEREANDRASTIRSHADKAQDELTKLRRLAAESKTIANDLVKEARSKSENLTGKAAAEAENMLQTAGDNVNRLNGEAVKLVNQRLALTTEIELLTKSRDAADEALNVLRKQTEAFKQKIQSY